MPKIKVAINGFGRIGRLAYRIIKNRPNIEVVAINGRKDADIHAQLLKYDTIHGRYNANVKVLAPDLIEDDGQQIKVLKVEKPSDMPWKEMGIDVVIESTGVWRKRIDLEGHIRAGAKKVILTVPSDDPIDATIVLGVNNNMYQDSYTMLSNASCTTNCLAPVAKILNDNFGIVNGYMTTVHAYTNDQNVVDSSHKDMRRARAAAENIIPTSTGAAKAIGDVIPELKGKLDGMAIRVPVACGSLVDLTVVINKTATKEEINAVFKTASEGAYKGIIEYNSDPLVSSDIIGNSHSAVFDSKSTKVVFGNTVKILAWYDNEWGYSNRVVDLVELIGK